MNITILGCGYVGSAIAQKLRQDSRYLITVTTTTAERIPELQGIADRVVVVKGNDAEGLRSLLQDQVRLMVTIAPGGNQQVDADGYRDTYLQTARTLVDVLEQSVSVRQVIYTSSCSVYGDRHGNWVDETSPVAPDGANGEILHQAEQILLSAAIANRSICILRLGAIYGPKREIVRRFGKLAGTTCPGTGNHFTNWIHLDDIVAAAELALTQELSGIFNVVSDLPLTIRDLFDQMCDRHNLPKVEWDPSQQRTRSNDRRVSNQKLKAAGYELIHPQLEV
jgi:nucleoside-diphosphate-sugar epimerase